MKFHYPLYCKVNFSTATDKLPRLQKIIWQKNYLHLHRYFTLSKPCGLSVMHTGYQRFELLSLKSGLQKMNHILVKIVTSYLHNQSILSARTFNVVVFDFRY